MKRPLITLLLVTGFLAARPAESQVFGQYTGAEVVPVNSHLFGGYVHASQDFLGLLAQLRLSFYSDVDFGFQGGLTRISLTGGDVTSLRVGADLKAHVAHSSSGDLAIGGALGIETGDHLHILTIGPTAVVSRSRMLVQSV